MFFQPMPYQAQGRLEPVMTSLIVKGVHCDSTVIVGNCVAFDMGLANATTFDPARAGVLQGSTTPPTSAWGRVRLPEAGSAVRNTLAYAVFGISRSAVTGSTSVYTPIDVDVIRYFDATGILVKTASATTAAGNCYSPVGAAGTLSIATGALGRKIVLISDAASTTTLLRGMFNGFGFCQDLFA